MSDYAPKSITDLAATLKKHYSAMHNRMWQRQRLYAQEYKNLGIQLPEGVPVHRSSTPTTIVDTLRDQIRVDLPGVSYVSTGPSKNAASHKALMELWARSMLYQIMHRGMINPFSQAAHDLTLLGASCIKSLVDTTTLPTPPERGSFKTDRAYTHALNLWRVERASVWPFHVRALDPRSVFPAPGMGRPPRFVVEVKKWTVSEARDEFPIDDLDTGDKRFLDLKAAKGAFADPLRMVDVVEYWSEPTIIGGEELDPGWYIIAIDGQEVRRRPNPYGTMNYVWSYSGLGFIHPEMGAESLATGVLDSLMGELEAEVRIKTAADAQWQFHVFPRLLTTKDPNAARRQFQKGPGAIIKIDSMAEAPKWLEVPPPQPAMYQMLDEVKENIFRRIPRALFERPAGVDAGVHQALLMGQASKIVGPIAAALDEMGSDLLNVMAKQARALNLSMNVRGSQEELEPERMVKPNDFKSFNFRVAFEAVDPIENDRRMLAGLSVMKERPRLMSRKLYIEKYMKGVVENPVEEVEQILGEELVEQYMASGLPLQALQQVIAAKRKAAMDSAVEDELKQRAAKTQAGGAAAPTGIGQLPSPSLVAAEEQVAGLAPATTTPSVQPAQTIAGQAGQTAGMQAGAP